MTTHQHLVAARNLIDREGWTQYTRHKDGVGYCIVGALEGAASCNGLACPAYHELNRTAWEISPTVGGCMSYNDSFWRTKGEVLALLDATIARTAPEPKLELVAEPVVELVA